MSVRKNNISEIKNFVQWCDVNQLIVNVGKTDLDIRPEKNNSVNISTGTSLTAPGKLMMNISLFNISATIVIFKKV